MINIDVLDKAVANLTETERQYYLRGLADGLSAGSVSITEMFIKTAQETKILSNKLADAIKAKSVKEQDQL